MKKLSLFFCIAIFLLSFSKLPGAEAPQINDPDKENREVFFAPGLILKDPQNRFQTFMVIAYPYEGSPDFLQRTVYFPNLELGLFFDTGRRGIGFSIRSEFLPFASGYACYAFSGEKCKLDLPEGFTSLDLYAPNLSHYRLPPLSMLNLQPRQLSYNVSFNRPGENFQFETSALDGNFSDRAKTILEELSELNIALTQVRAQIDSLSVRKMTDDLSNLKDKTSNLLDELEKEDSFKAIIDAIPTDYDE